MENKQIIDISKFNLNNAIIKHEISFTTTVIATNTVIGATTIKAIRHNFLHIHFD